MNKGRYGHAAVVCYGCVYEIGGTDGSSTFDCIERMDVNGLQRQSSLLRRKLYWTTLDCRLSTGREGFCAAAVHNRYIVIMGGLRVGQRHLQMRGRRSVEILDTRNHTVTVGPRINVPRVYCACAVIRHRIFVVGGYSDHPLLSLDTGGGLGPLRSLRKGGKKYRTKQCYDVHSVEYLDFPNPCGIEEETAASTVISSLSPWTIHSDLSLSIERMIAVGSCLVPPFQGPRYCCSLVTLADRIAMIGGSDNPSCATLSVVDKHTWCFRRLLNEPQSNRL